MSADITHIPHIPIPLHYRRVAKTPLTIAKLIQDLHLLKCLFLLEPTVLVAIIDLENSVLVILVLLLLRVRSVFNL